MEPTTYKGRKISFSERSEVWYFDEDGDRQENASLKALKAYIDKLDKKAWKRIPVFFEPGWRYSGDKARFVEGEITSVSADGRDIFLVEKISKERKKNASWILAHTPENVKKIAEIARLDAEEKAIEEKRDKVKSSLERVNEQQLKADFMKK